MKTFLEFFENEYGRESKDSLKEANNYDKWEERSAVLEEVEELTLALQDLKKATAKNDATHEKVRDVMSDVNELVMNLTNENHTGGVELKHEMSKISKLSLKDYFVKLPDDKMLAVFIAESEDPISDEDIENDAVDYNVAKMTEKNASFSQLLQAAITESQNLQNWVKTVSVDN